MAKKVFGLVSAGTSTVRKVGFFVCFDVPKKTLGFCIRTQKEILLFPFRCAGITLKVVRNYFRPMQPVNHIADTTERNDSAERHDLEGSSVSCDSSHGSIHSSGVSEVEAQSSDSSVCSDSESVSQSSCPSEGTKGPCSSEGTRSSYSSEGTRGSCSSEDSDSLLSNSSSKSICRDSSLSNDEKLPRSTNLDILTILTNGNTDAKEVAKQTKAFLTASLQSVRKVEKWRLDKQMRFSNESEVCSFSKPDDMFQSSQIEKELYRSLHATWNYCKALKAKREEIGVDFNKRAREFFSKGVPKQVTKPHFEKSKYKYNYLLSGIIDKADVDTAALVFEHGLQMCCNGTSGEKLVLTDYEELKSLIKRVAEDNCDLHSRVDYMKERMDEVDRTSCKLKAEVSNLTNYFHNMTVMEEKLKELQRYLGDTRDLLLRSEMDREDMACKLETLAKLIKEEEDFLNNSPYAKVTSLRSAPPMKTNKKIN